LTALTFRWRSVPRAQRLGDLFIVGLTIATQLEIWNNENIDHKPWLALVALIGTLPLLLRRRFPLAAPLVPAPAFAIASFFLAEGLHEPAAFVVSAALFSFAIGRWNERRRAFAGAIASWASILIFAVNYGSHAADFTFVTMLTFGPWLAGQSLRMREAQARELREIAVQLELEGEQRARAARADERLRIARELHDVIAHSISVMTIQAGAARTLLETEPARAVEPLGRVAEIGRQTLGEMHRLLGAIRPDGDEDEAGGHASLDSLGSLVDHYRVAGLPVELDVFGTRQPLGAGLDLTAYRIVQEALTNSLKYAGPATARVLVRFTPQALDLEIEDDGKGSGAVSGSGHGLVGMRERVTMFGGELRAGPVPDGGFAVRARLPLERSAV
jgi:signal transduction histidine kinase